MITLLKVGYKSFYLRSLLELFDETGAFEAMVQAKSGQQAGMRVITFGGKPHVLDCMNIL